MAGHTRTYKERMMNTMTDEQKTAAAEKRSATYAAKRTAEQERRRDRTQAIAICRQIRDNPAATDQDRLTAIQILNSMSA